MVLMTLVLLLSRAVVRSAPEGPRLRPPSLHLRGGEAVIPCLHTQTVAAAAKGCRPERDDHICDSVLAEKAQRARASDGVRPGVDAELAVNRTHV
jgi:hypothetical protein